ncbi:MAG TPA: methyltransferase domain-containing protein [Kofleriaceae bacterium]|nr:methyltransferase domain-containing protein [Kofleriaceae bacterium]
MTSPAAEGSLGAWLRRLPTYLYLVDLLPGKRVLEVGCGVGYGAQFLADHGAGRVVGVDRSVASITDARARHRQTNLEFRCEETGSIELDDASFDCIFVPDGVEVLRRSSVLGELRRLLARDGYLVLCGPSADRRGSPGGASFYEFRERLERYFPPVRMVAQAPFVGFSLVEYGTGAPGTAGETIADTHLDTSLLELAGGDPEASDYVAVCGGAPGSARGYTVVQVPERDGLEAAAAALGMRVGAEVEPEPAGLERPGTSPGEGTRDALLVHELRLRLETAISDRALAQAQAEELRVQIDELRARAGELGPEVDDLRGLVDELRAQLAQAVDAAESRAQSGPSPSEQIAEALGAHRDAVRSLEIAVEEGEAYAEELRSELEQASGQVEVERAGRQRAEQRAARLETELREWRTRASTAEGKLLRIARAEEPAVPAVQADPARTAEMEAELARARRGWQEAQAQIESMRADRERRERQGNGEASAPAAAAAAAAGIGREVARKLAHFELEIESGRSLLQQVEGGLDELEKQVAREAIEQAPSAWAAHRDQQLRELSAELGIKDAEIMILHIGVSALRARLRELVGDVRRTTGQARGRSMSELIELVEQLGSRVATFEERDEPA